MTRRPSVRLLMERLEDRTAPAVWTSMGPTRVDGGQVTSIFTSGQQSGVAGAFNAVLPHPTDANVVYAGSVNGGVFKTTNALSASPTWTAQTDSMGSLSVFELAFDKADASFNTVYAALGRHSSFASYGGAHLGLLKTTDGGANWSLVGNNQLGRLRLVGVAAHNGVVVVAAGDSGDGEATADRGVWRSTNGGTAWTRISGGAGTGLPAGRAFSLDQNADNPDVLYTAIFDGGSNKGVYRSADRGATWAKVSHAAIENRIVNSSPTFGTIANVEIDSRNFAGVGEVVYVGTLNNGRPSGVYRGVYDTPNAEVDWVAMDLPYQPNGRLITAATNASPIVITASNHGLSSGATVRVADVLGNTAANGFWTVTVVNGNQFSLNGSTGSGAFTSGQGFWASAAGISNAADNGAGVVRITTATANGLSSNLDAEVVGVAGVTGVNGIWRVSVVSTTTFDLIGSTFAGSYTASANDYVSLVYGTSPRFKATGAPTVPDAPEIGGSQGTLHFAIAADATNANVVYIAGDRQDTPFTNAIGADNFTASIWRGDASKTPVDSAVSRGRIWSPGSATQQWEPLTDDAGTIDGSAPHADTRDMEFSPNGNMLVVDDGGITRRTSPGSAAGEFITLNGTGLQALEATYVAYDAINNGVVTGNQDNGVSQTSNLGAGIYTVGFQGDGGAVMVDDVSLAAQNRSIRYWSNNGNNTFFRAVFNASGTQLSGTFPARTPIGATPSMPGQFDYRLNAVDPTRIAFGASNFVYVSANNGDTVSNVTAAVSANNGTTFTPFFRGMAYGGRRNGVDNVDVLVQARNVSGDPRILTRTADGDQLVETATQISAAGASNVYDLDLDPDDYFRIVAVDNDGVFFTSDFGATWTNITGNLLTATGVFYNRPELTGVNYIPGDRVNGYDAIVIQGRMGVFYASERDNFLVWQRLGTGAPNAFAIDADYDTVDHVLVVSLMGRGVWKLDDAEAAIQRNTAPVLDTLGNPTLTTIQANNANPAGNTVAQIVLDGSITDADTTTPPESIIVTQVDNTIGKWQYQLNGTGTWVDFTPTTGAVVSISQNAVVLRAIDSVRFLPDGSSGGQPLLYYRAWDQYKGAAGDRFDVRQAPLFGGTSPFSAELEVAQIDVTYNVPPVLTNPGAQTIPELSPFSLQLSATDTDLPPQTLTFTLVSGPGGLGISASGLLTWTPTEAQGAGSYSVTARVSDGITTDTETFTINVTEVNADPVLANPGTQVIDELSLLSLQLSATDVDLPAQALAFSLVSGPAGLTVSPTGLVEWTPTEAQGAGSYSVTARVGDGVSTADVTFTVNVNEVNVDPTIDDPGTLGIPEEVAYSLQLTATDPDVPVQSLTFSLLSGPAGLLVSASGVLTWTPTDLQGPGTYSAQVRVSDGVSSTTRTLSLSVTETNNAPVLAPVSDRSVNELFPLSILLSATDSDLPAQTLTYSLVSGPAGVTVSPGGVLQWTPTEAQGPAAYTIVVAVTDGYDTVQDSFDVSVGEVNRLPVLTAPPAQNALELSPFSLQLSATDADLPAQTLTFTRVAGPAGLTVSPAGLVEWTPTELQGPNTYNVTVRVSDGIGSATRTFSIGVAEANMSPTLVEPAARTIPENVPFSLQLSAADADLPAQTMTYTLLGGPAGLAVTPSGLVQWTPQEYQDGGPYTVTVQASDGFDTDVGTFDLTVSETNQTPVIGGTVAGQAMTDSQTRAVFADVTVVDVDLPAPTSFVATVRIVNPAHGVFTPASLAAGGFVSQGGGLYRYEGDSPANALRSLVFDPAGNLPTGGTFTAAFTVTVSDGVATATDTTTTAVVTGVNDAPTVTGTFEQTVRGNVASRPLPTVIVADPDSSSLTTFLTVSPLANGSLTSASLTASGLVSLGNGVYRYTGTPAATTAALRALVFQPKAVPGVLGLASPTTFSLSVRDGIASPMVNSAAKLYSPSVYAPPVVHTYTFPGNLLNLTAATGLLRGSKDVTGRPLTVEVVTRPTVGTLTLRPDGSLTYTVAPAVTTPVRFTVRVKDRFGNVSDSFVVTLVPNTGRRV